MTTYIWIGIIFFVIIWEYAFINLLKGEKLKERKEKWLEYKIGALVLICIFIMIFLITGVILYSIYNSPYFKEIIFGVGFIILFFWVNKQLANRQ